MLATRLEFVAIRHIKTTVLRLYWVIRTNINAERENSLKALL